MQGEKIDEQLLFFIASIAGARGTAKTSTALISKSLGCSQQSASRKLRALRNSGMIELHASAAGCTVSLSEKGTQLLKERHLFLQKIFSQKQQQRLEGKVKTGLGEGKYYISRQPYMQQFREKLGFRPFLGTLNLIVDEAELAGFLSGLKAIEISGFETEERSFGRILAFNVLVEGKQPGAIILPERTAHQKNEIEIISAVNLRKKFKLKEGGKATVYSG